MTVANLVSQCFLITSSDLEKSQDMIFPLEVGSITAIVSCDGALFVKVPAIGEERQYNAASFGVSAHDTDSIVG